MEEVNNSTKKTFFLPEVVGNSGVGSIEHRFETLIEAKRDKPYQWYQALDLDKSYASKIRRGLIMPPEWLRIKIAGYFSVDSSVIWKPEEIWLAEQCEGEDE